MSPPDSETRRAREARTQPSPAATFQRLWDELVSLLGTTATATLLRRSVKRASARIPELAHLRIERTGLEYAYSLPGAWREPGNEVGLDAVRRLYAEELDPLLRELTGEVVRRHLSRITELAIAVPPPGETR